jgi:DNA-binding GntR family transcriptional regulator
MTKLDVYAYRWVEYTLRRCLEDGDLKPGDQLPPLPALQAEYEVARDTGPPRHPKPHP